MIKVMICDDIDEICNHLHGIVSSQPDMEVVCIAHAKAEAVALANEHTPDVILMDIQMDSANAGIEASREISESLPDTKVIMLTIHKNNDLIVNAYLANAVDYILKTSPPETICGAIRKAYSSENYLGKLINDTIKKHVNYSTHQITSLLYMVNHISTLTPTELNVLKHLCRKEKRSKIAEIEYISENTLKIHIRHILRKLGFISTHEMIKTLNDIGIMQYLEETEN